MNNSTETSACPHTCVDCGIKACHAGTTNYPDFCLTAALTDDEISRLAELYMDPQNRLFSRVSAEIEGSFYCQYTRVEETVEFARRIGAKKIGIATCAGLMEESKILTKILRLNGFDVYGAICKVGAMKKTETTGLDPQFTCRTGNQMCNPILQAKLLNEAEVDLAIVMGLCVGHDTLFYKYIERPCTTLVVKDRVLGNNPVQALYLTRSYYKKLLQKKVGE